MAAENTKTENTAFVLFAVLGIVPFLLLFPIWLSVLIFGFPLYFLSMFLYVMLFGDKPAPPKPPPK